MDEPTNEVTLQEAARALKVSERTLRRRVKDHIEQGADLTPPLTSARLVDGRYMVTMAGDQPIALRRGRPATTDEVARLEAELASRDAVLVEVRDALDDARKARDAADERLREAHILLGNRDREVEALRAAAQEAAQLALTAPRPATEPEAEAEARTSWWRRLLLG